jgi:hypothetical protein
LGIALVHRTRHFASFGVKVFMPGNQVNKGRLAAVSGTTRTMQPLADLAAVIPTDGLGIKLFVSGCGIAQFVAPICMRPNGSVEVDADAISRSAYRFWRCQREPPGRLPGQRCGTLCVRRKRLRCH